MEIRRILFILTTLIFGWYLFNVSFYKENWRYNSLNDALESIKVIIKPSSCISYLSNNNSLEIYYKTQNIMAPIVVVNDEIPFTEKATNDTVIFLEDLNNHTKQLDSLFSAGYKQLANNTTTVYRIYLLKK